MPSTNRPSRNTYDAIAEEAGSIDVSFNAVSIRDVQLIPLAEISREDFMNPIVTGTTTHILTARAAARCMAEKGSGVILTLSASAVREYVPGIYVGGFGIACVDIEAQMKASSLLGRVTTLADVGNAAVFLASDRAGATTGTVLT